MPTLMERQLDAAAGQFLQRDLDWRGIAFFTNCQTEEIAACRAAGIPVEVVPGINAAQAAAAPFKRTKPETRP